MTYILDLYKKYPPKLGLAYIKGIWRVPWVLKPLESLSNKGELRCDKIKVLIGHRPSSDLALAYQMGVLDGTRGKDEAVEEAKEFVVVDEEWPEIRKDYSREELVHEGNPTARLRSKKSLVAGLKDD
jgi:hypothetical protein